MRLMILLPLSFLLMAGTCESPPPPVNYASLDTVHNIANARRIVKYDTEKCTIEIEKLPSHAVLGPELHGAFCFYADDAAKLKAHFQIECKRRKEERAQNVNSNY